MRHPLGPVHSLLCRMYTSAHVHYHWSCPNPGSRVGAWTAIYTVSVGSLRFERPRSSRLATNSQLNRQDEAKMKNVAGLVGSDQNGSD